MCNSGPPASICRLSQRLLNELSAARLCLLDAKKRSAYDTELRAKLGPQADAVESSPPPSPPPDPFAFLRTESGRRRSRRRPPRFGASEPRPPTRPALKPRRKDGRPRSFPRSSPLWEAVSCWRSHWASSALGSGREAGDRCEQACRGRAETRQGPARRAAGCEAAGTAETGDLQRGDRSALGDAGSHARSRGRNGQRQAAPASHRLFRRRTCAHRRLL